MAPRNIGLTDARCKNGMQLHEFLPMAPSVGFGLSDDTVFAAAPFPSSSSSSMAKSGGENREEIKIRRQMTFFFSKESRRY